MDKIADKQWLNQPEQKDISKLTFTKGRFQYFKVIQKREKGRWIDLEEHTCIDYAYRFTESGQKYFDRCLSDFNRQGLTIRYVRRRKDLIITKVDCKYGAPMGRANKGTKPKYAEVRDSKVPTSEGYDSGGAYWGISKDSELRVEYSFDLKYIKFYWKNIK